MKRTVTGHTGAFAPRISSSRRDNSHCAHAVVRVLWVWCCVYSAVAADIEDIAKWERLAQHGDAQAQYALGTYYLESQDTLDNYALARRWFGQAAERGLAVAQYALGRMHREGLGGDADEQAALRWLQPAADQGHARAQYFIGLMYGQGRGLPQSYPQAVVWYTRAARGNVPEAQHVLCLSYALGRGIASDVVKAYAWCDIAARAQLQDAVEAVGVLAESMTEVQIARAQQVAIILLREYVQENSVLPE